ncbi:response regulator transcription factor [uncultured Slackia sp.]|uniref:response regulator transcription factor n=1 Tax=uncultured Slackia sp. TaxID=665903 RepID=UPI0025E615B8|nr:response regulator transcription factor [uncultured Slackia sp.]
MRILIVEDDASIVGALRALLNSEGHDCQVATRQDVAVDMLEQGSFDLALLDVTLEQGTGFGVCAAAQQIAPDMPVIFLTASDDEFSTVAGLDMGAADYIAKPFRARELLARINAAARRAKSGSAVERMSLGNVEIDLAAGVVRKQGRDLVLSALEYRLLLLFAQAKGRLVTRDAIRDALWDAGGEYVSDNAITVYIKRLREKVEDDPSHPKLIETVRGLGYKALG